MYPRDAGATREIGGPKRSHQTACNKPLTLAVVSAKVIGSKLI